MDDIYVNIEKPSDNRNNRGKSGKPGSQIYANSDVIRSRSTATANTGEYFLQFSEPAVRCLLLLCILLLVGVIGLLGLHFGTRSQSDCNNAELSQLKAALANLTGDRDNWNVALANLSSDRDQILDAHNILKKQHDKLQRCNHVNAVMFGSSCYYISTRKRTWRRSRQDCQERGEDLVVINSIEEQEFVVSLNRSVWIGLSDRDQEGVWKWVDGTPLIKSFWYPTQPDDSGEEDCAENVNTGPELLDRWNDVSCSHTNLFICESNI